MRSSMFLVTLGVLAVAGANAQQLRAGSSSSTATTPPLDGAGFTTTAPNHFEQKKHTLFVATEPTEVKFDSGAVLKLKADVLLHENQLNFNFQSLSGVVSRLDPNALLANVPSAMAKIKPMNLDFALNPKADDAHKMFELGRPGSVDLLLSSDYFNAIFGYNYDQGRQEGGHDDFTKDDHTTTTHHADGSSSSTKKNNGDDHHDDHHHPVHEFDAASIPATLHFEKLVVTRSGPEATTDGSEAQVYLFNAKLQVRPRDDHIKHGVRADFIRRVDTPLVLPTRTLLVPAGALRPGKWIIDFRRFPHWKWGRFELKRKLCVQPVRVAQRRCKFRLPGWLGGFCFWWRNVSMSGRGLAFGQPSANTHWGQVDITFDWQPWITVIDRTGKYEALTSGAEETDLKNEVDDDECVEVFFVERFDPASRMGGGACWGGGTAGTKIISSDENVDCGTDITHLAHELGHALNLKHPGSGSATRPDGSTGTLLCPSGWEQDNPRRQSAENGDNASNPLLTSYLSFTGWWGSSSSPDCVDSADCGSCNAHLPNEPCV